jgi:hypothetical protein
VKSLKIPLICNKKNGHSRYCSLADRMDRVYEKEIYALRIIPNKIEIIASTIRI